MKKIKKFLKKLNNRGSSIIMVIVSVAFVAIIVAALLSAAAYAYRLKLVNKNAKDNFYYVEQAMQEIYAGVGGKTVEQMYDAYTSTIENMVYYDLSRDAYSTLTNEQANKMFKDLFMNNIQNEEYFKQSDTDIASSLQNFITNDTVKIDTAALHKEVVTNTDANNQTYIEKIILKDITLTRTSEYSNNAGSGTYTQTISADIEIGQPDFEVNFNNTSADYSNIFDYAMVADMGIEVEQGISKTLKISGNIYAASDYYNKSYNKPVSDSDEYVNEAGKADKSNSREFKYVYGTGENENVKYTHQSVSSKQYVGQGEESIIEGEESITAGKEGLWNDYAKDATGKSLYFDGVNKNSMYSGLYINNSNVSILAERVIVPGTIAIINDSDLSVYSKENASLKQAEVWADNIVLGGYGEKVAETETPAQNSTYKAPNAYFYANLYVRDDTELNAERSSLSIKGSYLGYGNSTEKDTRVFVPTVDTENFQIRVARTDENGNIVHDGEEVVYDYVNRDHYNSSAIVVNGQNATLDLSKTSILYLAGRAYIELSKDVQYNAEDGTIKNAEGELETPAPDNKVYVDADGRLTDVATNNTEVLTETYQFTPGNKYVDTSGANYLDEDGKAYETYISDYKTGESISLKSTQVAYIPIILNGVPGPHSISGVEYTCVKLHPDVAGVGFFEEFFPIDVFSDGYVPVVSQTMNNRTYYYYDLDTAYTIAQSFAAISENSDAKVAAVELTTAYKSADLYSAAFVKAYTDAINNNTLNLPLNDILANENFTAGNIVLNTTAGTENTPTVNGTVYSSGAITTKSGTAFNMVLKNAEADATSLLTSQNFAASSNATNGVLQVMELSKDISKKYLYIKWNLNHFEDSEVNEKDYVDKMLESGWTEDMITPINRYMDFSKIPADAITPTNFKLACGYKVWVSDKDITVGAQDDDFVVDSDGAVTSMVMGVIVTKGDVTFNSRVKKFQGLIIAGGKIYIRGNLENMTAAPQICRDIMRECIIEVGRKQDDRTSLYENCKTLLSIFREYSLYVDEAESGKCPVCGAALVQSGEEGNKITTCPTDDCKYNETSNANELLVDMEKLDYTDVCSIDNWKKTVE